MVGFRLDQERITLNQLRRFLISFFFDPCPQHNAYPKNKEHQMSDMNNLAGTVLNIKDLVSYQTGSVVSRTLIDKSVGTVTVFAFDHGQGLSEHTAPFDALVQIIDGTADITIDGSLHTVKEGEMIIMPANRPHSLKANPQFKMLLTMIRK